MTDLNTYPAVLSIAACAYQRPITGGHASASQTIGIHFPSCHLPAGDRAWLAGPSGSGKSTLLQVITALLPAPPGIVLVNGIDPHRLDRAQQTHWRGHSLGYLPQVPQLIDSLTVLDNLHSAAWATGQAWQLKRAQELLDQLGIASLAQRYTKQLSRGQAQRAALARALLLQSTLLLADEPTANLDDQATAEVLTLLQHVSEHGVAVLMASHDQRVAPWAQHTINMPKQVSHAL